MDIYDVVIIGGGQAGIPLAHDLAAAGRSVALVERKHLGGSCVNFGCTPTKAALASAELAQRVRRGADLGIEIAGIRVDVPAVMERARRIAREFRESLESSFEGGDNPALVRGQARLTGRDGDRFRVLVGDQALLGRQVVLNTGTRTALPNLPGVADAPFVHAGNWLELREAPESIAMLGGGYIGLEMSQFYRRIGCRVTVLEAADRIAAHEDEDVASALQKLLEADGVDFRLGTRVQSVRRHGSDRIEIDAGGAGAPLAVSHLFVATGRKPNTDDLGLETVGLEVDASGFVPVDNRLRTPVPDIWAAGDIRGNGMYTHTSWDDYRIIYGAITGANARTTARVSVYAVFTDPELGRAGLTETECRAQGLPIKVGRSSMASNGRAIESGRTEGFIKVIVHADTGLVLGAAALAAEGAELVQFFALAMRAGAPYQLIRDGMFIHPTLAEAVQSAVLALEE